MNDKKICVYAISKNEEKFVKRWYESVKEADGIFVLDTGSTDNTVKILRDLGVDVHIKKIKPWRFDRARNESLKLVPSDFDICVCIDMDEIISPGWKDKIKEIFKDGVNHLRYIYNWSHDKNNNPLVSFYYEKIHTRNDFKWIYPVHEILEFTGNKEVWATTDEIIVDHFPDNTKSRNNYLSLLELSVKENKENDRNIHYLGREYMFHKKYNKAIDTLIYHLSLKNATWKDERCASMRFIARCYKYLKRYDESRMWLNKAIDEAPYLRDPFVERAILEYELNNYIDAKKYCLQALNIKTNTRTYINEPFSFDNTLYDLLSVIDYYLENIDDSLTWINKAIEMEPDNKRLLNNKKIINEKKDKSMNN